MRLRSGLVLLLLLCLPCFAGNRQQETIQSLKTMDVLIAEGDRLAAAGRTEEAVRAYAAAVKVFERLDALVEGKPVEPPAPVRLKKLAKGVSRWDPPATLGHLPGTPKKLRAEIDQLVATMMDPTAGRKSLDAQRRLAQIGKPAFLPVLGAMARVRDTLTDNDNADERMVESSLKLADECLRQMDGYLDSKSKAVLRPGTDKKYIAYILRLHYKRWQQVLKDRANLPGPYKEKK